MSSDKEIKEAKTEDKMLFEWLNRAFDDLKNNPFCGIQISKKLIPKTYIKKYGFIIYGNMICRRHGDCCILLLEMK